MATITDLKGYTVTVPTGWTAYGDSGYSGGYAVNATMLQYHNNSAISVLGLGYNVGSEIYTDGMVSVVGGYGSRSFDSTQSLTFTFISGSTASEGLIQWLYDNNATFEKTSDTPEEPTPTATITYDGATVTLKEGQTVTFRFAEKVFKSDIVIKNNVALISFTIDGTTYYAEEGMTWEQWGVNEAYTNGDYDVDGEYYVYKTDTRQQVTNNANGSGGSVERTEPISAGHNYGITPIDN